ncbi:type II toxin-antitoxin system VapC family toxin [Amycolatopsis sp. H20-H5]|uniref:type II toxin-antitoxin system VapC family toxin n=1 Tax=Amycolatopsis sp. H20-H5 TaxID=3046309 RepID=UPI002DB98685|nr:type II toxin-antitoxin system VapC family toxin [Amycolatopsis sp. H20-H5]MEC3981854.1 type II toxin-antitoxin system VapC family toxin [Amycolatopsis sp. H20-H5]
MRVYLDSSAIIKRVIEEAESGELVDELDRHNAAHALLVSSSLAWIEVARALRGRLDLCYGNVVDMLDDAMSGVAEHTMGVEVVSLSRRLNPHAVRSLDAIHLASALLLDVDLLLTYDDRLADAGRGNGLRVAAPGRPAQ